MADNAKVVQFHSIPSPEEHFEIGNAVYITHAYFDAHRVSIAELPKFGWTVTAIIDNIVQIQYQQGAIKLLSILMVDKKYLKHLL
jgi:hypothetical protein